MMVHKRDSKNTRTLTRLLRELGAVWSSRAHLLSTNLHPRPVADRDRHRYWWGDNLHENTGYGTVQTKLTAFLCRCLVWGARRRLSYNAKAFGNHCFAITVIIELTSDTALLLCVDSKLFVASKEPCPTQILRRFRMYNQNCQGYPQSRFTGHTCNLGRRYKFSIRRSPGLKRTEIHSFRKILTQNTKLRWRSATCTNFWVTFKSETKWAFSAHKSATGFVVLLMLLAKSLDMSK